jgi:hypothetical protein
MRRRDFIRSNALAATPATQPVDRMPWRTGIPMNHRQHTPTRLFPVRLDMRPLVILLAGCFAIVRPFAYGQSADWQSVTWREPQVRYLLADMTLGGNVPMYREYATREMDPDSREAIRLWDAAARVVNTHDFERRWVTNHFAKDGRAMRVVIRGSNRTITGNEVLLTSDLGWQQAPMRVVLAELSMGRLPSSYEHRTNDASVVEALRRWAAGARALNTNQFEWGGVKSERDRLLYRGMHCPIDGTHVRLNSDLPYPETNVRYFLADIYLGGGRDFYHRVAETAHEMGCQEAVARYDAGVIISNLDQFERKRVNGQTLITRKGSDERISGMTVKLSTD